MSTIGTPLFPELALMNRVTNDSILMCTFIKAVVLISILSGGAG
jgi:hypothetical protein